MKDRLDVGVPLRTPGDAATTAFRDDPARWLPGGTRRAGERWLTYLWAGEVGVLVECTAGAAWINGDQTWRPLRLRPRAVYRESFLARLAPRFDGGLGVIDRAGRAELVLRGWYLPPFGLLGWLAARLGLRRLAVRTGRQFLVEVAEQLALAAPVTPAAAAAAGIGAQR